MSAKPWAAPWWNCSRNSCTVIVDEAAAAKLQGVDYYRWIFANEPEWEPYRG